MATFVLVHGAMHGGWCWRDVRQRLQSLGHEVYAPTLTGQGCRRGSLNPGVGVSTHVRDISDLLWFEDLTEVHLVLHSYAGVLAGPVAERQGDRLASVIFAGAFLTRPGECLLDVEPPAVAETVPTDGSPRRRWLAGTRQAPSFSTSGGSTTRDYERGWRRD